MKQRYFNFSDGVEIVYGPRRAAIYNLSTGEVFSVDDNGASILHDLEAFIPIDKLCILETIHGDSVEEFLLGLYDNAIGSFAVEPHKPKRENYSNPPPRTLDVLWLELTNRCNLSCIHCYADCGREGNETKETLSLSLWRKIIMDASKLSCKRLTFIGGEPFLESGTLLSLSRLASELEGIGFVEIFTNGTLFRESLLNELISTGAGFALSIYSQDSSIHDTVTQSVGSFEKTMKTLDFLASRRVPLRIAVIALRENEEHVEDTVASLRQAYPMAEVSYDVVRPFGRGCSTGVSPKRQFRGDIRIKPDFPKVHREAFWRRHHGHSCLWGKLVISSNGTVRPCVMDRTTSLGDVHEQSLSEIIESENTRGVWDLKKDSIPTCSTCEFKYACIDCRPQTQLLTGNAYAKPPECLYDPTTGAWGKLKGGDKK